MSPIEKINSLRTEFLGQLQFLASAGEITFWQPQDNDDLLDDELQDAFYELQGFTWFDKYNNGSYYRITGLYLDEKNTMMFKGLNDEDMSSRINVEVASQEIETLAMILTAVLEGNFIKIGSAA